jgi:hypothetical protein
MKIFKTPGATIGVVSKKYTSDVIPVQQARVAQKWSDQERGDAVDYGGFLNPKSVGGFLKAYARQLFNA